MVVTHTAPWGNSHSVRLPNGRYLINVTDEELPEILRANDRS